MAVLLGLKNEIGALDMFEETILSKRELGQDIRDMETNFHEKIASEPQTTRERADINVKERFLFERFVFRFI